MNLNRLSDYLGRIERRLRVLTISQGAAAIFGAALSFASAAAVALLVLIWLGTSGPGFLGYGTSLLWGGIPKTEMQPFYDITVEPGNRTVRKGADQLISARLVGFQAQPVKIFAKYK